MNSGTFLINDEFKVQPELNLVTVVSEGATTRLEPRLMKLLCLLTDQPGFVISRAQIINIIWDDYGGGDDGLTQAISFLRKTLKDADKSLITTISKKGYQFNGVITQPSAIVKRGPAKIWLYSASVTVVIAVLSLLLYTSGKTPVSIKAETNSPPATYIPFSQIESVSDETKANTISTTGEDGTRYKLFVRGDSRPKFFVNGRELMPDEMENYLPLIGQLHRQLSHRKNKILKVPTKIAVTSN